MNSQGLAHDRAPSDDHWPPQWRGLREMSEHTGRMNYEAE